MKLVALLLALSSPSFASTKASYDHYLKGLLLQRQGQYDDALREYQAAITIDPDSPFVLEQAAELALDVGQGDAAAEFAEALAKRSPEDPKAWHLLGNVRWSQGNVEGARKAYLKSLALNPDFADALYSMGNLLAASDPDKAKEYFRKFLKQTPSAEADVDYQIALIDHRQGDDDAAIAKLKAAVAAEPTFLQARYSLAQIYEARKDTEAAFGEYQALLPLDSQNVGLLVRLGELTVERGDKDGGDAYFQKAVAVEPSNASARFWLALTAEHRGDFAAAADQLSKSAALAEDPSLNLRLSYDLTQAGRLKEAVTALEAARARWPNDPDVAYFLGLGYDDTGQTAKAAAVLQDAVRLKPDSHDARFQLGAMLEKLNRMDEAEKTFRDLLKQRPDDAVALNYLGYSLAERGQKLPEAEKLISRAVELDPGNGAYLDSLGWVHYREGKAEAAAAEIAKALDKMPTDDTVLDHYGDVEQALGRRSDAWLAWMEASEHGGTEAELEPKAKKAAERMSSDELGKLYLKLLAKTQDRLPGLNALGTLSGRVGDSGFSFRALLTYDRASDRLRVDLLNPFWVPIWRLEQSSGAVDVGGLDVPGVPKAELGRAAAESLDVLHAYLRGDPLSAGEGAFKKGWSRGYIVTKDASLFLQKGWPARLESVRLNKERDALLVLESFKELDGRLAPASVKVSGKGYSFSFAADKEVLPADSAAGASPPELGAGPAPAP